MDAESRQRAMQTIATNVEEALHVKHQVGKFLKNSENFLKFLSLEVVV